MAASEERGMIKGDIKRGLTQLQSVYIRRFAHVNNCAIFCCEMGFCCLMCFCLLNSGGRVGDFSCFYGVCSPNPFNGLRKSLA